MHPIWIAFLLAVAVIPEGDIVNQDDYSPA
jgi:hypothetical protein